MHFLHVRFRFGSGNRTFIDLFGSGRTVKHWFGPSQFQKHVHDGPGTRDRPMMDMLLQHEGITKLNTFEVKS